MLEILHFFLQWAKLCITVNARQSNESKEKFHDVSNEPRTQALIKERLFAKSAFKRVAEENYYSHYESHESSLITRMKRRIFNKFSSHYMKIGLLSALFWFPHRETTAHVREFAAGIYVLMREFDDVVISSKYI